MYMVLHLASGGGPGAAYQLLRFGCRLRERAQVAHLAARPRLILAVQVQLHPAVSEHGGPVRIGCAPQLTEQVGHRRRRDEIGRAERQATHRPDVLLELAGHGSRDRQVIGVLPPGSDLVHQQAAVFQQEQFDAQPPYVVQAIEHRCRYVLGLLLHSGRQTGHRYAADVEDVAAVAVADQAVAGSLAPGVAGADHGKLPAERNVLFQYGSRAGQQLQGGLRVRRALDQHLALAVVAEAGGLQYGRCASVLESSGQRGSVRHVTEAWQRQSELFQEPFLTQAVLGQVERPCAGADERVFTQQFQGAGRDVLELYRHDRAAGSEAGESVLVVISGAEHPVGHLGGWCSLSSGRQHMYPVAERSGGQRQHAAQLTCPEDADGAAWRNWGAHGRKAGLSRGCARASSACWRRQRRSCSATFSSLSETMEQASSAALRAPASPMPSVPTGTPAGICTMDSSESTPASADVRTGTPSTGRVVHVAIMPGRWAAPPAAAMMTLKPSSRALLANSRSRSGVRWADTILTMCPTPNSRRSPSAGAMTGQSLRLPITTATWGRA